MVNNNVNYYLFRPVVKEELWFTDFLKKVWLWLWRQFCLRA